MLDFPAWKRIALWAITLVAVAAAIPSFWTLTNHKWPAFLPDPTVNLGLDLAGGSHLLLEATPTQVASQRLENLEETVRTLARQAEPRIRIGDLSTQNGRLSFIVDSPADIDRMREALLPTINGTGMQREWNLEVVDQTRMVLSPTTEGLNNAVTQAMDSAVEVVRKRIDSLGTREPTIIRQGDTRIVVQVPGLQDPQALKSLLGQTARLEFKLVDQNAAPADVAAGIAPPGSEIVPFVHNGPFAGQSIAVRRLGGIRGDNLVDATQGFEQQTNQPIVNIQFDQQGAARFAQLTTDNVGKPFAIILDGEVLSAPNINEPIQGGGAQISGGFTVESANELAIALRSGALPVDLAVVEERTVGPDLGADSIRLGVIACVVGLLLVMAFMFATYGWFGMIANIALLLNVVGIVGIMAAMNATLTLPGLAGFVLTIGAAVDANVIINERIREELRRGRKIIDAVSTGWREASTAILDANVTNFIAGAMMFSFGSGPIRGFAVVLMIGIVTSAFTAILLARLMVATWLRRKRPKELYI